MAELRATPMVNPVMGLLADRLKKVQQFGAKPFGYENPPVEMLMNLLGVPAVQQTMERMAYGEPLTTGSGMTTKPRAEAVEAAMTLLPASAGLAKATKGLPVGASIKPINIEKGIYKPDLTMEEMLKVRDIPTVERVQKSVELVGEKQFEKMVDAQFKKYKPSSPEQEAMLVESVTLQILGKAQRSPFPRQEALDTAQRNAALPIEEGGLGLPKDNTAMDRAKAMNFDIETYHGTNDPNISSIDISKSRPDVQYMQGFFTSDDPNVAGNYGDILMPFLQQKGTTVLDRRAARQAGLEVPAMDTIYDKEKNILVTNNPSNIRSRFAAFDPMRRDEADILAGVLPLGLLADEEQRKKIYELMPSLLGQ